MNTKPLDILLIEDNPGDIDLTYEALLDATVKAKLHVVKDGKMALRFLKKEGQFNDVISPDLILLDLNLPGMSGHEILHEMAKHPSLKKIPVIVLTTSDSAMDMVQSYNEYAKGFITKPIPPEKFDQLVKGLDQSWFNVA